MKYRSGWELTVAKHLDENPEVLHYQYEAIKIPYILNKRTGKIRNYLPDFYVTYTSGRKLLIEVKRNSALNQLLVKKKEAAARLWAMKNGSEYEFWTDQIVLTFQKIQKAQEKQL
jgi:hypothetical protein